MPQVTGPAADPELLVLSSYSGLPLESAGRRTLLRHRAMAYFAA